MENEDVNLFFRRQQQQRQQQHQQQHQQQLQPQHIKPLPRLLHLSLKFVVLMTHQMDACMVQ